MNGKLIAIVGAAVVVVVGAGAFVFTSEPDPVVETAAAPAVEAPADAPAETVEAVADARPAIDISAGPQITGSMENFTLFEEPVPAPDVAVKLEDGGEVTLDAFNGRVTLVNFWATWCGPCIREMPELQALHDEFGGEDFAVALISQDMGGWPEINKFKAQRKISTPEFYLDEGLRMSQAIGVRGLPQTFIVDGGGNIIGNIGFTSWETPEAHALIEFFIESNRQSG